MGAGSGGSKARANGSCENDFDNGVDVDAGALTIIQQTFLHCIVGRFRVKTVSHNKYSTCLKNRKKRKTTTSTGIFKYPSFWLSLSSSYFRLRVIGLVGVDKQWCFFPVIIAKAFLQCTYVCTEIYNTKYRVPHMLVVYLGRWGHVIV